MTLAEIIKESFSLKEAGQKDDVVLNTLDEWESMAHMLFITRVEEEMGVEFTGDDIFAMQTIGDIKRILAEKGETSMILSDANILITGGASGLGKTMATHLAGKAANVIVIDRNAETLAQLSEEFPAVKCYNADLTNLFEVEKVVAAIFNEFGRLNVLVNNAGIIHSEPLINILSRDDVKHSVDNWHKTIDVNLNAVFYATLYVAEKMVKNRNKGVIINISSISSYGNVGQSAYSATKAALNALTVTWSKELGMFGIRCVAIAPGFIDTPSTRAALTEAKITSYKNATPIRRLGNAEELLHAVVFIIENDFYNGTVMNLDGGFKL